MGRILTLPPNGQFEERSPSPNPLPRGEGFYAPGVFEKSSRRDLLRTHTRLARQTFAFPLLGGEDQGEGKI